MMAAESSFLPPSKSGHARASGKAGTVQTLTPVPSEGARSNGGSEKFIDATFALGNVDAIRQRIDAHYAAGASHVCVQPVNPNGQFGELDRAALEALEP
jgi:hypothetical protein